MDHTVFMCYGVVPEGYSVCLEAFDVLPYLWVEIPERWVEAGTHEQYVAELVKTLDEKAVEYIQEGTARGCWMLKKYTSVLTPRHKIERHINVKGYHSDDGQLFAKIYVLFPRLVPTCRALLQSPFGNNFKGPGKVEAWLPTAWKQRGVTKDGFHVLEAHVPFESRCFVDNDLPPCGWWRIPRGRFSRVPLSSQTSLLNVEYTASMKHISRWTTPTELVPATLDGFFDAEMETSIHFPDPRHDRVIQISLHAYFGKTDYVANPRPRNKPMPDGKYLDKGNYVRLLLAVGSVDDHDDFTPVCFATEREMLLAFYELVVVLGICTLVGHNSNNFDFRYILARCEMLGIKEMAYLGRHKSKRLFWKEDKNIKGMSRATTRLPGMVTWDFLHYSLNFLYLQDNTLDGLAKELLKGVHKKEMNYSEIATHQKTRAGRTKLAEYCDYDVRILRLFDEKCNAVLFLKTLSNLCYVDMQNVLDRASEFKIMGLFMWYTRNVRTDGKHFLVPTKKPTSDRIDDEGYAGATVIEAAKGYYLRIPIFTLDFKSLYPSIMRCRNLCYSTYLAKTKTLDVDCAALGLDPRADVWKAPRYDLREDRATTVAVEVPEENPTFVKKEVRYGIIPQMEQDLYDKRNADKGAMKPLVKLYERLRKLGKERELSVNEHNEMADLLVKIMVLDAAQQTKKIVMNATYGIIAAMTSNLRLQPIAETITREARQFLEITRYWIETNIRVEFEGWGVNAEVVYGDTDSVMVKLSWEGMHAMDEKEIVRKAWDIAIRAMRELNAILPEHLILELEKLSMCTLFMKKKKYIMHMYNHPDEAPKILVKGSSKRRRDGCAMKREMCGTLIETLVARRSKEKAVAAAKEIIASIRRREIPESKLVMMKTLRNEPHLYKNQKLEQVVMAKKLKSMGFDVRVGDQMHYMIAAGTKKELVSARVVTPDEVLSGEKQYDVEYYEGVAMKEARRLLALPLDPTPYEIHRARQQFILKNPEVPKKTIKSQDDKAEAARARVVDKVLLSGMSIPEVMRHKQVSIMDAFATSRKRAAGEEAPSAPAAKKARPTPSLKRKRGASTGKDMVHYIRHNSISQASPLFKHVVKQDSCVVCTCAIPETARGICRRHRLQRYVYYRSYESAFLALVHNNLELWDSCPQCDRGCALIESCDRMSCPNWGTRRKIQTDYIRLTRWMDKLKPTPDDMLEICRYRIKAELKLGESSAGPADPLPSLSHQ